LNMPLDNHSTPTVVFIVGLDGSVRSTNGFTDPQVTVPSKMGGTARRTSPEDRFAAAFAACTDASGPKLTLSDMLSMLRAQSEGD
jgi:hypothetical protein